MTFTETQAQKMLCRVAGGAQLNYTVKILEALEIIKPFEARIEKLINSIFNNIEKLDKESIENLKKTLIDEIIFEHNDRIKWIKNSAKMTF